ncbi:MAG: hypothetical protein JXR51_01580 [Bacteroidales bacterium]|nr:hypothetical protein [Bacteroidales bacterium]
MKKLILLGVSILVIGFISGVNLKTPTNNNKNILVIENRQAIATMQYNCNWRGWLGIRRCEAHCSTDTASCTRSGGCHC